VRLNFLTASNLVLAFYQQQLRNTINLISSHLTSSERSLQMNAQTKQSQGRTPILLLKTKSAPTDTYEELFSTLDNYVPIFIPVLEHRFKRAALHEVKTHITSRGFVPRAQHGLGTYGALIFTSQRAVEAFSEIVDALRKDASIHIDDFLPASLPLYVVGPATARGLEALNLPCPILGQETGNGEALAAFMLQHYNSLYPGVGKPPMLFLVGDKRRDIIPRTLQDSSLGADRVSTVDELVIYDTGEMASFLESFSRVWKKNAGEAGVVRQWVVVFSPTGCRAMLESLGLLDARTRRARADVLIATIGPTTRDYLKDAFGFEPDVCAERPSPEGIAEGIRAFSLNQR
jgi:uroporphyrinogen-III synthase